MRRDLTRLTWFCAVLCLSLPVGTTRAQDDPPPAAAAEARKLEGKLVQIYHDVDLTGAGKPSPLHTEYLGMVLRQAGATITRNRANGGKKPDVVIIGEHLGPPKLEPADAADPFLAMKAKRLREEMETYNQARPKLEADAAAAGARVLRSADVAGALGIRVTEAQIVEALDARAREALRRVVPGFDAERANLGDVVDLMRDASGANIQVNWRALEAAGVDRHAPLKLKFGDAPMSVALDRLLAEAGGNGAKLGYVVRAGIVMISTEEDLKAARRPGAAAPPTGAAGTPPTPTPPTPPTPAE